MLREGDPELNPFFCILEGSIQSALSDGCALRLVLHQPDLDVQFILPAEGADIPEDQVMIVTELGRTFTFPQYQLVRARQPRP